MCGMGLHPAARCMYVCMYIPRGGAGEPQLKFLSWRFFRGNDVMTSHGSCLITDGRAEQGPAATDAVIIQELVELRRGGDGRIGVFWKLAGGSACDNAAWYGVRPATANRSDRSSGVVGTVGVATVRVRSCTRVRWSTRRGASIVDRFDRCAVTASTIHTHGTCRSHFRAGIRDRRRPPEGAEKGESCNTKHARTSGERPPVLIPAYSSRTRTP